MPVGDVALWIALANSTVALAGVAWSFLTSGSRTNAKALEEHRQRIELVERQIDLLGQRLDRGPTPEAMQQIFITLARMEGQMEVFNERLMPVKAIAERLQEQALSEGKR